MKLSFCVIACILHGLRSIAVGSQTLINFEEINIGGGIVPLSIVYSGGYVFSAPDDPSPVIRIGFAGDMSTNGTHVLYYASTESPLFLAREDGAEFDFLTADLGEGSNESPTSQMSITGVFADGGSVTKTIVFDGILPPLQQIEFSGFTHLDHVIFEKRVGFAVDNLVLVPEPTSAIGFLFLVILLKHVRSSTARLPPDF